MGVFYHPKHSFYHIAIKKSASMYWVGYNYHVTFSPPPPPPPPNWASSLNLKPQAIRAVIDIGDIDVSIKMSCDIDIDIENVDIDIFELRVTPVVELASWTTNTLNSETM